MINFERVRALVVKEFHQIKKDPSSLLISGFLPILLLFLYGYGLSFDYKHMKIGVVLEDTSPLAQSFLTSLQFSEYFDVDIARNKQEIYKKVTQGKLKGCVVIPSYFSTWFYNGYASAPLQIITDGSEPNTATLLQNYIKGAFSNWLKIQKYSQASQDASKISLETRMWYNSTLESKNYLIPGSLAIILTLIGTLLTSLVISREWERGTMESLISTPVKISEIILAKLISYFFLGVFAFVMSVFLTLIVYAVPLKSSLFLLTCVAAIFLLSALGMGLLISSLFKNQFAASQAAIVSAFLPSFFLSGFIYEVASMPKVIQILSNFFSAKYFVSSLQTLFLVGFVARLILFNTAMMLFIAAVFFVITLKNLVKRLE
jgi:ABC-2 type transport system permease protein